MKTLDTFSKRILIVAASISMVLLSLSAFLLSVQRVTAGPEQPGPTMVTPTRIGLGIDAQQHIGYYGWVYPDGTVTAVKIFLPY